MNRASFLKGLIICFVFVKIRLNMDLKKGHTIDQKEFLDLKYLLFSGIGGYTSPPLTENHSAQKPLAELGGTGKKTAKKYFAAFLIKRHLPYRSCLPCLSYLPCFPCVVSILSYHIISHQSHQSSIFSFLRNVLVEIFSGKEDFGVFFYILETRKR